MNKVWLTGDAVVDLIPDTPTTYLKCPGGAPANVAVGVARLGCHCGFFGRVGLDPLGKFMKQTLLDENVDVESLKLDKAQRTSTVLVDLDEHGERTFTFMVKPSADQFMQKEDIPQFEAGQWLHACSIALANEPSRTSTLEAIQRMKQVGGFVSFDPNLREEVWQNPNELISVVMKAVALADVVKFSEEELMLLTGAPSIEAGIEQLAPLELKLIVITQGEHGALVIFNGKAFRVSATTVKVIDTTGAGDAFVCGLLARLSQQAEWLHEDIVLNAVEWGNACGGLATTEKGAMTALPTRTTLDRLLSSRVTKE
ncbi:aminoimidazole riboside kinase [Vibrio profundi]|uniref:aminoimidazole riboside kinase n=1 Tax=Vibrio profundi TaxID=1774960 RepID=UPI003736DD3B